MTNHLPVPPPTPVARVQLDPQEKMDFRWEKNSHFFICMRKLMCLFHPN